jgi:hypothetical protein
MIEILSWIIFFFCVGLLFGFNYARYTYGPWLKKQKRLEEEHDKKEYDRLKKKYDDEGY